MDETILDALNAIPVASTTYEDWLRVGMALHYEGCDVSVWDTWSKNDSRYDPGVIRRKWKGFKDDGNAVKAATIISMAQKYGWKSEPNSDKVYGWDDEISFDGNAPARQTDSGNPAQGLIDYLLALYEPNDYVGYVVSARNQSGKYIPSNGGIYFRTRDQLVEALRKYGGDIASALGDYNHDAGAWIRPNPLDGKGAKDENVTRFSYALVESDEMPIEEQEQKVRELRLPVVAMVHSGGKSLHAIVRVDARDTEEYRKRVVFLYDYLEQHGLRVDKQNKNPSRLSRMPSVMRNGQMQRLIATNIGYCSWVEWKNYAEGKKSLPEFEDLSTLDIENPPEPPEPLIDGILRRSHKMLIAGASKSGKSFLLMQLAIAISEGRQWLGHDCKQGRVLYINLEIEKASANGRIAKICQRMGINRLHNLEIWHLRGYAAPLDELLPELVSRIRNQNYTAVILDPIYKVITGDENNASEMGQFCNQFDRICTETGAAAIYCHHHSKGAQGAKQAQDRASGSGVFARDPDAILDMSELVITPEIRERSNHPSARAFRIESSLREFPNITPINIWYEWPIHVLDTEGILTDANVTGSAAGNLQQSGRRNASTPESRHEQLVNAFSMTSHESDGTVKLSNMLRHLKKADGDAPIEKTARNWIKQDSSFDIKTGFVRML